MSEIILDHEFTIKGNICEVKDTKKRFKWWQFWKRPFYCELFNGDSITLTKSRTYDYNGEYQENRKLASVYIRFVDGRLVYQT